MTEDLLIACNVTRARWRWWEARLRVQDRDGVRLTVERADRRSGIPWEILQLVKSETWGPDVVAVEVYPPDGDIVNACNMRHLWRVRPEQVPTFGRREVQHTRDHMQDQQRAGLRGRG